jgi:hypothetical protein
MKELDERALDRHAFDGEWNYTVRTAPAPAAAGPVDASWSCADADQFAQGLVV